MPSAAASKQTNIFAFFVEFKYIWPADSKCSRGSPPFTKLENKAIYSQTKGYFVDKRDLSKAVRPTHTSAIKSLITVATQARQLQPPAVVHVLATGEKKISE
jgi:hypothetical protein